MGGFDVSVNTTDDNKLVIVATLDKARSSTEEEINFVVKDRFGGSDVVLDASTCDTFTYSTDGKTVTCIKDLDSFVSSTPYLYNLTYENQLVVGYTNANKKVSELARRFSLAATIFIAAAPPTP